MILKRLAAAAAMTFTLSLAPQIAQACACGCDVFDVGGPEMMPTNKGGEAFVEYDYMDQNTNWSGGSSAPAANNSDKEIRTHFITAGLKYTINQDWGALIEVPVWNREFHTENAAGTGVDRFNHTALGDVRLMGVYSGLTKDHSTGLIFGLKLPTGDWKYANFDRDTEIGTGSTNLLLGAYRSGMLSRDGAWGYYAKGLWDKPLAGQGGYLPGQEFDASAGVSYHIQRLADGPLQVIPVLQMIGAVRSRDSGPQANPVGSGYERLLISPGVEIDSAVWRLYGDVELPFYQRVNGDQLTARVLFKLMLSRRF